MDKELYSLIHEFMRRDHQNDSERLNQKLTSSGNAGLVEEMPPIPFTGDIEAMDVGNCVCLLGINPLWPAVGKPAHELELKPAIDLIKKMHSGDEQSFDKYLDSRLNYFNSGIANWGHFDKVGHGYSEHIFTGTDKRSVWERNAFAMDVIPYFSRDATNLNRKKIVEQVTEDPALIKHQRIMSSIISKTQPSILHLNGSHAIELVEELYCENPLVRQGAFGKQFGLRFGEAKINHTTVKVFAHNQFGYGRYNPAKKHWPEFARLWQQWNE